MIKLSHIPFILVLLGLGVPSYAQVQGINQRDEQGRRHGQWKKTYSSGKLRYQGQFKHGLPADTFRHYFDNGQLRTLNVFRGRSGNCMSYQYGEDKLLAGMGLYRDKKKDSVWTFFDRDSNLVARESYERGQRQGPSKKYFENGQLAEITHYEKDQKEGPWKQFYRDGTPKSKAHYRAGKLRGEAIFFHPNGRPRLKGKYVAGKMHGIWYFFTRKGKIEKKQRWRYGFKVALDGSKQTPADSVKDTSTVAPMPHW